MRTHIRPFESLSYRQLMSFYSLDRRIRLLVLMESQISVAALLTFRYRHDFKRLVVSAMSQLSSGGPSMETFQKMAAASARDLVAYKL